MKKLLLIGFVLVAVNALGQLPQEKPLYPDGIKDNPVTHTSKEMFVDSLVNPKSVSGLNRVYSFVSEPTYMIFPADSAENKNVGLVILPGGGFKNVWVNKEGTDIALWLSKQGITCMVVKYRTNCRDAKNNWTIDYDDYKGAIYQDARTAMQFMKSLSGNLHFDKNKVGMIGFSAGGWLTERIVFKYYQEDYDWKPDYVALIYHGNYVQQIKKAKDKEKLPPFFMAIAENDNKLPYKDVISYLKMVSSEVKNSELHVYPDGGHGFGLAYDETSAVAKWKFDFLNWIDKLYK